MASNGRSVMTSEVCHSIFKSENNRGRAGNVDSKFEVLDELGAGMTGYI
jgi:hypothetical protein